MNFDECLAFTLEHEGSDKFTDDPQDPGGATKYGIAQNYHRGVDVRNLTLEGAAAIYRSEYWDKCRCEELPALLRLAVFDAAVNAGVGQSIRFLQRGVGVTVDEKIGGLTLNAAQHAAPSTLSRMLTERIVHYGSREGFCAYGRGWVKRCLELQETVLRSSSASL